MAAWEVMTSHQVWSDKTPWDGTRTVGQSQSSAHSMGMGEYISPGTRGLAPLPHHMMLLEVDTMEEEWHP